MNMNQYKKNKVNSKNNKKTKLNKIVFSFFNRLLLTIIIFLLALIVCKSNIDIKNKIYKYVYNTNFKFSEFNKIYKKYLGDIIPVDNVLDNSNEKEVFNEKLNYKNASIYKDGVKLEVSDSYLVPALKSGIVVYIGNKDEYKNTIIIQQTNGIDVWYGNITNTTIKMYDYIEEGTLLGETKDNYLYMVFAKEGKFLNYKDYI